MHFKSSTCRRDWTRGANDEGFEKGRLSTGTPGAKCQCKFTVSRDIYHACINSYIRVFDCSDHQMVDIIMLIVINTINYYYLLLFNTLRPIITNTNCDYSFYVWFRLVLPTSHDCSIMFFPTNNSSKYVNLATGSHW